MVSTVTKTLLKNVIRHTDAHNKVEQDITLIRTQTWSIQIFYIYFSSESMGMLREDIPFFILFNIKESEYFLKQLNTCRCCHVSNSSKSNLNRFFTLLTLLSKCDVTQRQKCN